MAEITYFKKAGEHNTSDVLNIALNRYQKGGIDMVVVASSFGVSAEKADEVFRGSGAQLLIVGEIIEGKQSPRQELCKSMVEKGHNVIWGTTMGAMSSFTSDKTAATIADAYRRVSEGFKVVSEIVLIAASQGYLLNGQKVLSMAGTHRGLDTAVVATAAPFAHFKDFEVNEILCKPIQRPKK